jgi:hypothetical protein
MMGKPFVSARAKRTIKRLRSGWKVIEKGFGGSAIVEVKAGGWSIRLDVSHTGRIIWSSIGRSVNT